MPVQILYRMVLFAPPFLAALALLPSPLIYYPVCHNANGFAYCAWQATMAAQLDGLLQIVHQHLLTISTLEIVTYCVITALLGHWAINDTKIRISTALRASFSLGLSYTLVSLAADNLHGWVHCAEHMRAPICKGDLSVLALNATLRFAVVPLAIFAPFGLMICMAHAIVIGIIHGSREPSRSPWKFVALTLSLSLATFAFVYWIADGGPVPGPKLVAAKPSARLPTFRESVRQRQEQERRAAHSSASDYKGDGDPTRTRLRLALINATKTLERNTCNASARREFATAFSAYMNAKSHDLTSCGLICRVSGGMDRAMAKWETPLDDFATLGSRRAMAGGTFHVNVERSGGEQTFTLSDDAEMFDAASCR